jgi:hypothetical protein
MLSLLHPQRKQDLEDSLQAHQYFADANEAESWMKEKEPIVCNTDYGKDEDSSEALLKKHEALVSDLEAFGNTISALREQAQSCRVSVLYSECYISKLFLLSILSMILVSKDFLTTACTFSATRNTSH